MGRQVGVGGALSIRVACVTQTFCKAHFRLSVGIGEVA